ncbi:MAG: hypothetical protein RLZZ618_1053 [Pseudomonadota bacterium]|jgi:RimJ/RimL family protein N-acetyltransferase
MADLFHNAQVIVRPIIGSSADELWHAVRESQPELAAWETWALGEYTPALAEHFLADCATAWWSETGFTFALIDPASQKFIGTCTLLALKVDTRIANLGYWVHSAFAGRGIATTAAKAVADYGLAERGFQRLEIMAQVENLASRRVAEKTGARFEGVLPERLFHAGHLHDAALYALGQPDPARGVLSPL